MATSLNGTQHPVGFSYRTGPRGVGVHCPGNPYRAQGYSGSWLSQKNGVSLLLREWKAMASLAYVWQQANTLNHQLEPTTGSPSVGCSKEVPRAQTTRANVMDRSPNDHLNKVHPGCRVQSAHTQHECPPGPVDVIQAQYRSPQKVRMFFPFIVEHAEQSLETFAEMLGLGQGHRRHIRKGPGRLSQSTLISQNRLL